MIETKRLSSQYILLDFMADHAVYNSRKPLCLSLALSDENLAECKKFVERFLDPLTEKYGPTSIAGGFLPETVGQEAIMKVRPIVGPSSRVQPPMSCSMIG